MVGGLDLGRERAGRNEAVTAPWEVTESLSLSLGNARLLSSARARDNGGWTADRSDSHVGPRDQVSASPHPLTLTPPRSLHTYSREPGPRRREATDAERRVCVRKVTVERTALEQQLGSSPGSRLETRRHLARIQRQPRPRTADTGGFMPAKCTTESPKLGNSYSERSPVRAVEHAVPCKRPSSSPRSRLPTAGLALTTPNPHGRIDEQVTCADACTGRAPTRLGGQVPPRRAGDSNWTAHSN